MCAYISRKATSITPYVAGEQPTDKRYIKLNTNENAYPPSPKAVEAMKGQLLELALYPPLEAKGMREAIAKHNGIDIGNVFVGNGSDEVLALSFLAFFDKGQKVASPKLSYSFYPVYAGLYDIDLVRVPMIDTLYVDVDGLIAQDCPVVIANPNAPTSVELSKEDICRLADALLERGHLLLLDEAYAAFGTYSCQEFVNTHENVVITRTFSKSHSMAGLRAGYAIAQRPLIEALEKIKDSFNSYPVDRVAQAGAQAAIEDEEYFNKTRSAIKNTRDNFLADIREMGFIAPDSRTNFVFCYHPKVSGKLIFDELKARGILVRRFDTTEIKEYLRISIGTDDDMNKVAAALREIIKNK
ncbi:MAG: histidinol-phosphate transaminase [Clostridiales bacterium]|nr:histidinol-phosphate transaminase [Clostridiales bacterium]